MISPISWPLNAIYMLMASKFIFLDQISFEFQASIFNYLVNIHCYIRILSYKTDLIISFLPQIWIYSKALPSQ